jgi:hypothetical protein
MNHSYYNIAYIYVADLTVDYIDAYVNNYLDDYKVYQIHTIVN